MLVSTFDVNSRNDQEKRMHRLRRPYSTAAHHSVHVASVAQARGKSPTVRRKESWLTDLSVCVFAKSLFVTFRQVRKVDGEKWSSFQVKVHCTASFLAANVLYAKNNLDWWFVPSIEKERWTNKRKVMQQKTLRVTLWKTYYYCILHR